VVGFPSSPKAHPSEGSGSFFLICISILPMATADVDMSKLKLSPSLPLTGAQI
jgi:hypothetical protein